MILLEKIQKLKIVDGLLVLGFLLVILGIGMNFKDQFLVENEKVKVESKNISPVIKNDVQVDSEVVIDISGEVMKPGVYKLKNGLRIEDVLIMVGGLNAKADRDWVDKNLNRAEKVYDGQKIYIPNKLESEKFQVKSSSSLSDNKVIRLNSASLEELDKLDGVGPAIAQRIIDYRTENGGFKSVEEIKLVPGIGDKMFEKIKDEIQL
ncbi:MAG: helix-hairpin-helix domain-containing protein [Candidatus Shapirobacteria bacterium]|nr:helix-hairpin-helix domain-containing protein [Candidatus Shapirobacteria bacterium]